MPKINIDNINWVTGTDYPSPFDKVVKGRARKRLGNEAGLNQFGVNLTKLEPGASSALRHWHENEDEFVYVIKGELTLIENSGSTLLSAGDAAAWKAADDNAHHLVNNSQADAIYIEIGTRAPQEITHYPDDDLSYNSEIGFTHKDGTPIDGENK